MGATPAADPTLGIRDPTPMRHLITVTPRIAEALASTFTLHPHITAIGTADPDIFIIGITAGIVISKVARSLRAARCRGFQPRCWSAGVALNAAAMAIAGRVRRGRHPRRRAAESRPSACLAPAQTTGQVSTPLTSQE